MAGGTKTFLGWAMIVLGVITGGYPLVGVAASTAWNVILGILVIIGGIWLLATK